MRLKITVCLSFFLLAALYGRSQENYPFVFDRDAEVVNSLERWKDLKFGLLMHWGTYSQWGVVESWSLCPEDEGWTERKKGPYQDYFEYRKAYEALANTFNPVHFNPVKWAAAAKDAGFKYVVFTTKHHDGFCMFDTKQTDYRITAPNVPFHNNPKADVTKEIFNAFRKEGFFTGAYFSKPDWHSEHFWWPYFPPKDRNINYDLKKYPERWKAFSDFTYNQIEELTTKYGKIDLLWLDGAWVMLDSLVNRKIDWQKGIPAGQDVDMNRIGAMARKNQPGILIVDRWVPTKWENYHTPEQAIPEKPLPYPWETCMTMANSWSYVPNDQYKSAETIINNLVAIVCNGGNYLLNVAPGPDGEWHAEAYERMKEIGQWMKVNGEGIYNSRPYMLPKPESKGVNDYIPFCTVNKEQSVIYRFRLSKNGNDEYIKVPIEYGKKIKKITLLGSNRKIKWKFLNGEAVIDTRNALQDGFAVCYKIGLK